VNIIFHLDVKWTFRDEGSILKELLKATSKWQRFAVAMAKILAPEAIRRVAKVISSRLAMPLSG
jgi:hypothetical protein